MNEASSKIVNVFFFSSQSKGTSGISSLIYRMIYNSFEENITLKENLYQYKIYTDETSINFNFFINQERFQVMNSLDFKNENIIIFVYNLDKTTPLISIAPILEETKLYLNENFNKIKIGLVGNNLDLIKSENLKKVIEKGEKFAEKIKSKFLLTSAKTGKGDLFQFIIDILNSKSRNELIKNKKSLIKEYIQLYKTKNINNINRCEICKTKILITKFHEKLNKIEFNCKENHKRKFISIYKEKINNPVCKVCEKEINDKNYDSLEFCKICQILICHKCVKKHEHNSEEDIISPFYAEDQICSIHGMRNDLCCLNCNSLICSFCYNIFHSSHKIKKVDNKLIDDIIKEKKKLIKEVKDKLDIFNNFYSDLINTLNSLHKKYNDKILLDLKIKENILHQFETIKYNNELYNTVFKMEFNIVNKNLNINNNLTYLDKLTLFFNYIDEPIQITKYNICNGNKSLIKTNLLIHDTITDKDNSSKILTDACIIDNNLFCVSFYDGSLKIYDYNNMESYKKIVKLYDDKKGINSILKYNNDNLIISGYEKIYKIKIDKELELEKEILINESNSIFTKLCSFNLENCLLYADNLGNIGIYNFNNKNKKKINNSENLEINNIIDIENIHDNIFYMKYKNYELNLLLREKANKNESIDIERFTISERDTIADITEDQANSIEIYKIFYLDKNYEMCNQKLLSKNIKILGAISRQHLVIQEENENLIKYKILDFINNKEFSFGNLLEGLKRDWNFKLIAHNIYEKKVYFVLVDFNFNILEYLFEPSNNNVQEIGFLTKAVQDKSTTINNKIIKIMLNNRNFIIINSNGEFYKMKY